EGEPLSAIAGALSAGGASVRAAYPGVWLTARAWATHGHYLDVHTTVPKLERLSAGAMARLEGRPSTKVEAAEDYEAILQPIYAWLHACAQNRSAMLEGSAAAGSTGE